MKKVLLIGSLMISSSAFADAITGSLVFDKKASFAGILYATDGQKAPQKALMDQKDKVFTSKMVAVGKGGAVEFNNSDSFQHNIFANDPGTNVKFDVGLMEPGQSHSVEVNWQENTLTRVGCKIHPRMRTYIANVPSDTFQVFEFEKKVTDYQVNLDVEGNQQNFTLAIPKYDDLNFSLAAGESKTLDVTRKGKKKATLTVSRGG